MNNNSYVLLILGAFFIFVGIWMRKKDKEQFKMIEDRLTEKEKSIYELYESLEGIMEEMERLYNNSRKQSSYTIISKKVQDKDKGQEEYEENEYKEGSKSSEDSIENTIIKLKNEGISEEDIARKLGIGKGEVKLILDLKK